MKKGRKGGDRRFEVGLVLGGGVKFDNGIELDEEVLVRGFVVCVCF